MVKKTWPVLVKLAEVCLLDVCVPKKLETHNIRKGSQSGMSDRSQPSDQELIPNMYSACINVSWVESSSELLSQDFVDCYYSCLSMCVFMNPENGTAFVVADVLSACGSSQKSKVKIAAF